MRAIETLKDIVGDRLVGSSLGFWQDLEAAQVSFVLRRNPGLTRSFRTRKAGHRQGPKAVYRDVGDKGWSAFGSGATPNPWEPEEALRMDLQRMKIDATFRDRRDRMNRSQESMGKMGTLLLGTSWGRIGPPPSESREPGESPDPPAPPAIPSPEPGNPPAPPRRSR